MKPWLLTHTLVHRRHNRVNIIFAVGNHGRNIKENLRWTCSECQRQIEPHSKFAPNCIRCGRRAHEKESRDVNPIMRTGFGWYLQQRFKKDDSQVALWHRIKHIIPLCKKNRHESFNHANGIWDQQLFPLKWFCVWQSMGNIPWHCMSKKITGVWPIQK